MKKKVYFIISAILQILGAVLIIINVNPIIQQQLSAVAEDYAAFPVEIQERAINMIQSGIMKGLLIIGASIQIILNAFVIKYAIKNTILKNKGKLIAFSIICFFIGESPIIEVLSIINFIVLLCLKRKSPEDFQDKEKKEIPKLEYEKPTLKEKIMGIILIVTYFSQLLLDRFIPENISRRVLWIIIISVYVLLFALAIIVIKDRLKRDIKLFKENARAYFQYVLPRLGIMYVIYIAVTMGIIVLSGQASSVNQSAVNSLPLGFSIPIAVIWAPIVEETIFRGIIRRFIKNNVAFIMISAVIFGLLHTYSEATIQSIILMAVPYTVLGGFFAYIYAKTENITNNILIHGFHNAIAMIITVLISGLS